MVRHGTALALAVCAQVTLTHAADWPQFRGPNRDGKSPETGLLKVWPEAGPGLVRTISGLGEGYSSPSIAGGRLYITGKVGDDLRIFCFERTTSMRRAIVKRNHMPDRMTYARLGKTGFLVSRVSLGGYANHGMSANADTMASADPDAYRAALQYLLDNGVNFIDTAPDYATEGYIGELLSAPGNRGRAFVCTKVEKLVKDLETGEPFSESEMRESFRSGLAASLEALRLDRIDVLLLHHLTTLSDNPYHNLGYVGPNYDHLKMAYDVIDGLIAEGLVTHKGFTSHWTETTRDAVTLPGLAGRTDVAVIKYMVTRKWFEGQEPGIWEREVLPALTEHDVGVVQMKVLMGPHQTLQEKVEILNRDPPALARVKPYLDDGDTVPQALIRWSLAQEAVHTRIIGITRVSIAEEDLVPARPGTTRNPSTSSGTTTRGACRDHCLLQDCRRSTSDR